MNIEKAKQAIDRMMDSPPKRLYAEVLDVIALLKSEGFDRRAKNLSEALWAIIHHAAVNVSCDRAWYGSEPCRRPQAPDDGHECGELPNHEGSCRCKCGETCFK